MQKAGGENRRDTAVLVRDYSEKVQCTGKSRLHAIYRGGIGSRREQSAAKKSHSVYAVSLNKGAIDKKSQQNTQLRKHTMQHSYSFKQNITASVPHLPGLLDPLKVKEITLRNRIVMPPMQSGRATFEGAVTNRLINYYTKRTKHIGLCIIEHAYISQTGKLSPKQLGIHNDTLTPGLEKLTNAIHQTGTPAILQITHAGAVANQKIIGTTPAGPSPTGKTRQLQKQELETIADEFAQAAERAINAGFDGIELHGAHGYLLNQFYSPLLNKRTDEYGGTLENRIRFPLTVTKKIRKTLNGKLLLYRLGADDLTPKGTQIEDSVTFAQKLENAGADIIDVSGGMCGSEPKQLRHLNGYFVPQAHDIKKAVHIPVIGVGKITDANYADSLLKDGKVDLVAVGRALLKDAKWAEKAIETIKKEEQTAH